MVATKAKTKAKTKRRTRRRPTVRIYYGPPDNPKALYWTVPVADAKKPVTINGTLAAALRGHPGVTIGCALSEVAQDNAKQFGHAVYYASFTASTAVMADRLKKDGSPGHAIRYGHSYSKIVDMNDDGTLKKLVNDDPGFMERPFHLRAPRKRPTGSHRKNATPRARANPVHHVGESPTLRGAMRRAVKAGRMSEHVAAQITRALKDQPKATDAEVAA